MGKTKRHETLNDLRLVSNKGKAALKTRTRIKNKGLKQRNRFLVKKGRRCETERLKGRNETEWEI